MLADELRAQHPPQQTERRVGHAVGAALARLGVVVEHAATDVIDDAVEVIGHDKAARDLDVRAENLQQRGRKNIVRMKFSAVGKAFCRDFHGFLLFVRLWLRKRCTGSIYASRAAFRLLQT